MKRYNFDRKGFAEGIAVHAEVMEVAIIAGRKLNLRCAKTIKEIRQREQEVLIFRDNEPCISKCSICGVEWILIS